MCVKLNSLFDSEKKVYNVTQVLKQGINIKTMCPNYIIHVQHRIYYKSLLLKFSSARLSLAPTKLPQISLRQKPLLVAAITLNTQSQSITLYLQSN